jgi:transcription elongation factor GreB
MPRWKPPPLKSSPYITPAGAAALDKELKALWQQRRREVVPALSAAAAEGDRSENAEYIYRKKQLGEIDRRVRYLSKRLDEVQVVDRTPADQDKVFFGAWVLLETEDGEEIEYRIVGADETDPEKRTISVDSPMARALLGRTQTAEIAIKAAQTGHLVLSTLHTNDAPKTLTRLVDMGVKPYAIASSVSLIIAQRLARRLCSNCKEPEDIPAEALLKEGFTRADLESGVTIFSPKGCSQCTNGYKGRVGIYQVMPCTETIGRIIMEGGNALQIAAQAKSEGVADLRQSGLKKVKDGLTSLEEINRVTVD